MHLVAPWMDRARALVVGALVLASCARPDSSASSRTVPAPSAAAAPTDRHSGLRHDPAALVTRAGQRCPPVTDDHVWRFIDPVDSCPQILGEAELARELNDAWAVNVLRASTFPTTVEAVVAAISKIPAMASGPKSYLVGEGSQVELSVAPRDASRDLRYVITWSDGSGGTIFLSALPGGSSPFLQLIAWDATKHRFNFYEYSDERPGWIWAGDSSYARRKDTFGHGCFDCHHNGTVIMKELSSPWNNWHSTKSTIQPSVIPESVAREALFQHKTDAGQLEDSVRSGFAVYHEARLNDLFPQGNPLGPIGELPALLGHIISQSTVNLVSTSIQSDPGRALEPDAPITGLPRDFFVRDGVLRTILNLNYTIPPLSIGRSTYNQYLKAHQYQLLQSQGRPPYRSPGSTYFAFFVPVPSDEDTYLINALYHSYGMVNDKFIAAVQMVDFANPVFSAVRDKLLKYADQVPPSPAQHPGDIPARFAALVGNGAQGQPPCEPARLDRCSAEQQFLFFWNLSDDNWRTEVAARVQAYLNAVAARLATPQGVDDYMRLAASRREQLARWPVIGNLVEFSLLFPHTSLPTTPLLQMNIDGSVGPISTGMR